MTRVPKSVLIALLLLASPVIADEVTVLDQRDISQGEVLACAFAPSGDRVGRVISLREKYFVVVNGEVGAKYDFIDSLVFSRLSGHYAYRARTGGETEGRWCIVVDGKEEKTYSWVGPPALTPDGSRAAYWATRNGRGPSGIRTDGDYFVVFGGKPGRSCSGQAIRPIAPVISPDGKKVAYPAPKSTGVWHVVVDKRAVGKGYSAVGSPVFSRDSKRLAYPAAVEGDKWAIVDSRGRHRGLFDAVSSPVLGKGKSCAFVARERESWLVVHGKTRHEGDYALITRLVMSEDGKRIAFFGNKGGRFERLPGAGIIGPGAARLITGGTWHLVVDGRVVVASLKDLNVVGPVFGPRSRWIARGFRYMGEARWKVFCGNHVSWNRIDGTHISDSYEELSCLTFAPDGKSLGFGARRGKDYLWVTLPL